MKKLLTTVILSILLLCGLGIGGIALYQSDYGLRLRAQLGQPEGQVRHAVRLYQDGQVDESILAIQAPLVAGYEPATSVICGFVNDHAKIADTAEGCVQHLQDNPQRRLWALTETAQWALEWDVVEELLDARLANGDATAHFDRARFFVLSRPDTIDIEKLFRELELANNAQDPRGQYAYMIANLNTSANGALSSVLAEVLARHPSLTAGDAYFELAKLIQTGAISSDLNYVEILQRSDQLGNSFAAGYLAQYYLSNPDQDETGEARDQWLMKAASQGDAVAQYNIALAALNDPASTFPKSQAVEYLNQSAGSGFVPSLTLLGVTLWQDPSLLAAPEVEVRQRALALLEDAAAQDDVNALFNLGSLLVADGQIDQAKQFLERAADLEHWPSKELLDEVGAGR